MNPEQMLRYNLIIAQPAKTLDEIEELVQYVLNGVSGKPSTIIPVKSWNAETLK